MKNIWLILPVLLLFSCKSKSLLTVNTFDKKNTNVLVYGGDGGRIGPCEPSIFINPAKPKNIVAGSVLNYAHYSFDGGATWKTSTMKSSHGVYGDPVISADQKGNFYYLHLGDPDGTNWSSSRILESIVIQKSTDGGITWNDGAAIGTNPPKQQDKEWVAINPTNGELYVTWTQFDKYGSKDKNDKSLILFSKSSDGGNTWTKGYRLSQYAGNCMDDDDTVEGAVPSVGTNGEVYVAWAYDEKIYFDRSMDAGNTWLEEDIVVVNQPGGWTMDIPGIGRTNGMPVTGVDHSNSKYRGTIYVNWADTRNGKDNSDIFIARSKDQGKTWSAPTRVNTDSTSSHQFFPWMSVDAKTGVVYIVYYDRSMQTDRRNEVTLAYSTDGGKTFKSEIISESSFPSPGQSVFFGDYNNISAYDGMVRPIWTRYDDAGGLSVWTALVKKGLKVD